MAKALLICHRRSPAPERCIEEQIGLIGRRLTPDNLETLPVRIARDGPAVSALFGPGSGTRTNGASLCLGVHDGGDDWAKPGTAAPDGSFALYRVGRDRIELVADGVASRTIWYALTDEVFVASSSQRAIVALLGSFDLDRAAAAWMLSSGTLGPQHGWDARLKQVPLGGRVVLDRNRWRLQVRTAAPQVMAQRLAPSEHRRNVEEAVEEVARRFRIEPSSWVVPLSGGIDSRGLLLAYRRSSGDGNRLRCVTWGRRASLGEPESDATVARRVARRFDVEHRFLATDLSSEPRETLIERFLVAGEGRVASISGYLDGFELWKALRGEGIEGVVRGDEAFGWSSVWTGRAARHSTRLTTLEDFFDARVCASFELPQQRIPDALVRQPRESVATWRDRLYREFRVPSALAALTDLKSAYVEVANPLLAESVLRQVRRLPDAMRTDKRLWREIVAGWAPGMGSARTVSIMPLGAFLRDAAMRELLRDELASATAEGVLGTTCCAWIRSGLDAEPRGRRTLVKAAAAYAPRRVRAAAASKIRGVASRLRMGQDCIDPFVLAFRALIVSRMSVLLESDAGALAEHRHVSTASYP